MAPPLRTSQRTRGRRLQVTVNVAALAVIGAAAIAGILGYTIGGRQQVYTFTPDQMQFIDGLVAGTQYRADNQEWLKDPDGDPRDERANPDNRCAGDFFPAQPMGMQGCLLALEGRPPEGYKIPTR